MADLAGQDRINGKPGNAGRGAQIANALAPRPIARNDRKKTTPAKPIIRQMILTQESFSCFSSEETKEITKGAVKTETKKMVKGKCFNAMMVPIEFTTTEEAIAACVRP